MTTSFSLSLGLNGRRNTLFKPAGGLILAIDADHGIVFGSTMRATGTTPPAVTMSGTPADSKIGLRVKTSAGVLGVATYQFSEDNGTTYSTAATTAATVALTGPKSTGITIAFPAGTYSANNVYDATVQFWQDQSGTGIIAPQQNTSIAYRPRLLAASLIGSKPALEFDSSILTLIDLHNGTPPSFGPFTIVALLRGTALNSGLHTPWGFNNSGDTFQNYTYNYNNFGSHQAARAGGTSARNGASGWLDTATRKLVWTMDGTHAGHQTLIDGVNVSSAWTNYGTVADPGVGVVTWTTFRLGGNAGGSFRFDGVMRAVRLWNRALTPAELVKANTELGTWA